MEKQRNKVCEVISIRNSLLPRSSPEMEPKCRSDLRLTSRPIEFQRLAVAMKSLNTWKRGCEGDA